MILKKDIVFASYYNNYVWTICVLDKPIRPSGKGIPPRLQRLPLHSNIIVTLCIFIDNLLHFYTAHKKPLRPYPKWPIRAR